MSLRSIVKKVGKGMAVGAAYLALGGQPASGQDGLYGPSATREADTHEIAQEQKKQNEEIPSMWDAGEIERVPNRMWSKAIGNDPIRVGGRNLGTPIKYSDGTLRVYSAADFVKQLVTNGSEAQSGMYNAEGILESELKRGWLSQEKAKEAKESIESALDSYEKFKALYGYLHHTRGGSFRKSIDFFAKDVRQEVVSTDGSRAPYPTELMKDLEKFANAYSMYDKRSTSSRLHKGDHARELTEVLYELEEPIRREGELKLEPKRNVPWCGYGEWMDEYFNPGTDVLEGLSVIAPIFLLLGGLGGYVTYLDNKSIRKEAERKKKEGNEVPDNPDLVLSGDETGNAGAFDPWSVSVRDKDGGKVE